MGNGRFYTRSVDGGTIAAHASVAAAESAALQLGEGACVIDTQAPAYVPMLQQVVAGQLQILGVGGWGANRLSLEQNFLQAIKRKQVAIVHAFLASGADPDTRDDRGQPAIIWSVASGQPEIVQLLLDKGANPDSKDLDGMTAIRLARQRAGEAIVQLLIEAGVTD